MNVLVVLIEYSLNSKRIKRMETFLLRVMGWIVVRFVVVQGGMRLDRKRPEGRRCCSQQSAVSSKNTRPQNALVYKCMSTSRPSSFTTIIHAFAHPTSTHDHPHLPPRIQRPLPMRPHHLQSLPPNPPHHPPKPNHKLLLLNLHAQRHPQRLRPPLRRNMAQRLGEPQEFPLQHEKRGS